MAGEPPNHGSISASLQNTLLQLTVAKDNVPLWTGSASLGVIALWVAGPPLLLALTRRWTREVEAAGDAVPATADGEVSDVALPPPQVSWRGARPSEAEPTRVIDPRPTDSTRSRPRPR